MSLGLVAWCLLMLCLKEGCCLSPAVTLLGPEASPGVVRSVTSQARPNVTAEALNTTQFVEVAPKRVGSRSTTREHPASLPLGPLYAHCHLCGCPNVGQEQLRAAGFAVPSLVWELVQRCPRHQMPALRTSQQEPERKKSLLNILKGEETRFGSSDSSQRIASKLCHGFPAVLILLCLSFPPDMEGEGFLFAWAVISQLVDGRERRHSSGSILPVPSPAPPIASLIKETRCRLPIIPPGCDLTTLSLL